MHGTTIATNTVLKGKGARVGLLVTTGFRVRPRARPLVDPRAVAGWVRMGQAGAARRRSGHARGAGRRTRAARSRRLVDPDEVRAAVEELERRGVESIDRLAAERLRATRLEQDAAAVAARRGGRPPGVLSSDVLPEFREYEANARRDPNAYVQPAMTALRGEPRLGSRGRRGGASLHVLRSDGGLMTASRRRGEARPSRRCSPGRQAAGAAPCSSRARRLPELPLLRHGRYLDRRRPLPGREPAVTRGARLERLLPRRRPTVDVRAVGAGGGSLAHVPSDQGAAGRPRERG